MLSRDVAQRIDRTLVFQEADRVPICDFLDHKKIFYYFSHTSRITLPDKVKAYHELGIDICWRFERRQKARGSGLLEHLHRFALRKARLHVLGEEELDAEFRDFKEQQKLFEPHTYLAMSVDGCLSAAYRSLGFEEFSRKMYVEPIEVEKLIDIFAENLYQRALRFAEGELGRIFFINDGIAYDKGLIFSPVFLQQQWFPRIKNAIAPLKKKGIKVILHSLGNLSSIIKELIDIGIDGIHPIDAVAGMDIAVLKKTYPKRLLLFGNVALGQQDRCLTIPELVKHCIHNASSGGGHFIGSRTGIEKNIPLQDVFSFFIAIKEYGKYPLGK